MAISARYVHPSEDTVLLAMSAWVGTNLGTASQILGKPNSVGVWEALEHPQFNWWAVQDSNLRPPACKAGALTS